MNERPWNPEVARAVARDARYETVAATVGQGLTADAVQRIDAYLHAEKTPEEISRSGKIGEFAAFRISTEERPALISRVVEVLAETPVPPLEDDARPDLLDPGPLAALLVEELKVKAYLERGKVTDVVQEIVETWPLAARAAVQDWIAAGAPVPRPARVEALRDATGKLSLAYLRTLLPLEPPLVLPPGWTPENAAERARLMNGPEGDAAARVVIAKLRETDPEAAAHAEHFEAGRRRGGKPDLAAVPAPVEGRPSSFAGIAFTASHMAVDRRRGDYTEGVTLTLSSAELAPVIEGAAGQAIVGPLVVGSTSWPEAVVSNWTIDAGRVTKLSLVARLKGAPPAGRHPTAQEVRAPRLGSSASPGYTAPDGTFFPQSSATHTFGGRERTDVRLARERHEREAQEVRAPARGSADDTTHARLTKQERAREAEARGHFPLAFDRDVAARKLRPAVLLFALTMEQKLRENDPTKPGWKDEATSFLEGRLIEEVDELRESLITLDQHHTGDDVEGQRVEVLREAADVGNLAMMLADNEGGLRGFDPAALCGPDEPQPWTPPARLREHVMQSAILAACVAQHLTADEVIRVLAEQVHYMHQDRMREAERVTNPAPIRMPSPEELALAAYLRQHHPNRRGPVERIALGVIQELRSELDAYRRAPTEPGYTSTRITDRMSIAPTHEIGVYRIDVDGVPAREQPISAAIRAEVDRVTATLRAEVESLRAVQPEDLAPGDVVRLKSGGPPMTVREIDTDDAGRPEVQCMWSAKHGCADDAFLAVMLEKVPAGLASVPGTERDADQSSRIRVATDARAGETDADAVERKLRELEGRWLGRTEPTPPPEPMPAVTGPDAASRAGIAAATCSCGAGPANVVCAHKSELIGARSGGSPSRTVSTLTGFRPGALDRAALLAGGTLIIRTHVAVDRPVVQGATEREISVEPPGWMKVPAALRTVTHATSPGPRKAGEK